MKNVFVFGADPVNMKLLSGLEFEKECRFHTLFDFEFAKQESGIPVEILLQEGLNRLKRFEGSVDGIVAYWDFPLSTMLPLLRKPFGLPSPSFVAVLKCEHKFWSRMEQSKCVPEHIPNFEVFDPFDKDSFSRISIKFPFWLKPVKSVSSHLGFRIENREEFEAALFKIKGGINRFAKPFDYLLALAEVPEEIRKVHGGYCMIESIISDGEQCTLEGFCQNGCFEIYGAVDSIREGTFRSSFSRYQYPSSLPERVLKKMEEIAGRFFGHIGFDDGPFNIEFFWNPLTDKIFLLEVNPRISKSHSLLFKDVDGQSNQKVMVNLAMGEPPDFPFRKGKRPVAAKFMWRHPRDAFVRSAPGEKRLESLRSKYPEAFIQLLVGENMFLSDMREEQDSYSYELANIFIGGDSEKNLVETYESIKQELGLVLVERSQSKEGRWRLSTNFLSGSERWNTHGSP